MGYLNKETVTVDAILTKKGRELLAQGRDAFRITKFAVSDDEIDYGLYNTAHPLGSEYYGSAIENMPVVEASPDETQNLRYKLVTLPVGQTVIPTIRLNGQANFTSIPLVEDPGAEGYLITPSTQGGVFDATAGYTLTIFDADSVLLEAVDPVGAEGFTTSTGAFSRSVSTLSGTAIVVVGQAFRIRAGDVSTTVNTQITVTGNESGATITVPVTVTPETIV